MRHFEERNGERKWQPKFETQSATYSDRFKVSRFLQMFGKVLSFHTHLEREGQTGHRSAERGGLERGVFGSLQFDLPRGPESTAITAGCDAKARTLLCGLVKSFQKLQEALRGTDFHVSPRPSSAIKPAAASRSLSGPTFTPSPFNALVAD